MKQLIVVVPHSGLVIPSEIPPGSLSDGIGEMLRNVDWHTNVLYDFRDILDNQHISFQYLSLVLEANRHPGMLDESVPLQDVFGAPVYRPGAEPAEDARKYLAQKYLVPFHKRIEEAILSGADFLLDGHSTIAARGVAEGQIDLMNFQHTKHDDEPKRYSPSAYVETYAEELRKRLPDVKITVNESEYYRVHGHVCAEHSVDALGRVGRRVPALIQETSQGLYMKPGGIPDAEAIDRLRRAFAESIRDAVHKVRGLGKAEKIIELHSLRQTFDYDCGAKALQTVMAYYGVEVREDVLLEELKADRQTGINWRRIAAAAEKRGFEVEAGAGWSMDAVKRHVSGDHPVIVLLQAWADKFMTIRDWRDAYDFGHYAVVMGYNKELLFFEDPSSFHRTWLKQSEFLARWHDRDPATGETLMRFGMALLGKAPVRKRLEHMG